MDIPSIDYLLDETAKTSQPIWQVVLREEQSDSGQSQEQILDRALHTYEVMKNAAMSGIASDMKSVSGLTGGDAAQYYNHLRNHKSLLGSLEAKAVAYALGTSGYNAAMGVVVACPTAGAAGIVPGVLIAAQEEYGFSDREAVYGLLTASGIGGVVVDAGTFNWKNPKFALYNEPDRGYHGLRFAHDLPLNLAFILRLRTVGLRNQGPTLAPDAAWIFLQGVESLPLRVAKHSSNALKVAKFLAKHPKVAWVKYPTLSEPELAKQYLPDGAGGMVVFGVKGGSAEARKLVDSVPLFSILANVGDAKSLIIHPASTTHSQVSDEEQRKAGLLPELIRLSIGLEHPDDIIAALEEGLAQI